MELSLGCSSGGDSSEVSSKEIQMITTSEGIESEVRETVAERMVPTSEGTQIVAAPIMVVGIEVPAFAPAPAPVAMHEPPHMREHCVFEPSNERIIHYLNMKINNKPLPAHLPFIDIDILQQPPKHLIDDYWNYGIRGKKWYFFNTSVRKHKTEDRVKRVVNGDGVWKVKDERLIVSTASSVIGRVRRFEYSEHNNYKPWNKYSLEEFVPESAGGPLVFQPITLCRMKVKLGVPPVVAPPAAPVEPISLEESIAPEEPMKATPSQSLPMKKRFRECQ